MRFLVFFVLIIIAISSVKTIKIRCGMNSFEDGPDRFRAQTTRVCQQVKGIIVPARTGQRYTLCNIGDYENSRDGVISGCGSILVGGARMNCYVHRPSNDDAFCPPSRKATDIIVSDRRPNGEANDDY